MVGVDKLPVQLLQLPIDRSKLFPAETQLAHLLAYVQQRQKQPDGKDADKRNGKRQTPALLLVLLLIGHDNGRKLLGYFEQAKTIVVEYRILQRIAKIAVCQSHVRFTGLEYV